MSSSSYSAENGKHDDCIMTLVLFAWMVDEMYFKELYENNIRENLMKYMEEKESEENYLPFGFLDDGVEEYVPEEERDPFEEERIEILKQNAWLFEGL